MAIQEDLIPTHWNYFLCLEDDIDHLSRYIEFTKKNYECFSLELARILLTAASEVDVVSKLYCKLLDPASKAGSIGKYKETILLGSSDFPRTVVQLPRFGLTFKPWSNWQTDEISPFWWQSYNKVKHQRNTHFHRANLQNVLNSVAGLFALLTYYYRHQLRSTSYQFGQGAFKKPELFYNGIFFHQ